MDKSFPRINGLTAPDFRMVRSNHALQRSRMLSNFVGNLRFRQTMVVYPSSALVLASQLCGTVKN